MRLAFEHSKLYQSICICRLTFQFNILVFDLIALHELSQKYKDQKVKLIENYIIITIVVELNRHINIEIIDKILKITINVTKVVIALDDVERKINRFTRQLNNFNVVESVFKKRSLKFKTSRFLFDVSSFLIINTFRLSKSKRQSRQLFELSSLRVNREIKSIKLFDSNRLIDDIKSHIDD